MDKRKTFYVYIILTVTSKLYCGYTDNLERRYKLHCTGKGAKFTRANKPLKLVYTKKFSAKSEALKEENRIKKLSRKKKLELIKEYSCECETAHSVRA